VDVGLRLRSDRRDAGRSAGLFAAHRSRAVRLERNPFGLTRPPSSWPGQARPWRKPGVDPSGNCSRRPRRPVQAIICNRLWRRSASHVDDALAACRAARAKSGEIDSSLRAKRSNPGAKALESLDCFVAPSGSSQ
jgi:hypothetical protein